ncbi:MAG: hypothetical protein KL801_14465 [Mesorhizobium sp.]|nr:hypothetical protein [Mesorhizobium sp.]
MNMPAKTPVATPGPLSIAASVSRHEEHHAGEEDAERQGGRRLAEPRCDQPQQRGGQQEPGKQRRAPVGGDDIGDEAVADADIAGDCGDRRDRQNPRTDVDDGQPQHQQHAADEAGFGHGQFVGERHPADQQHRQRDEDCEERVPEAVD